MNERYQGTLDKDNVETAIEELKKIQLELQAFSPDKVVWDIDDLSNQPPWGKNISNDITNLSNYFVTSDGEDFIIPPISMWMLWLPFITSSML